MKTRNSRVFDISTPFHFIKMRGPHLKGFAEVAVWKQDIPVAKMLSTSKSSSKSHFYAEPIVDGKSVTSEESTQNSTNSLNTVSVSPQNHEGIF